MKLTNGLVKGGAGERREEDLWGKVRGASERKIDTGERMECMNYGHCETRDYLSHFTLVSRRSETVREHGKTREYPPPRSSTFPSPHPLLCVWTLIVRAKVNL